MPELPEVETSRQGILPYLKGQHIAQIIIRQPKLRWPIDEALYMAQGQEIVDVLRRAKYLLLKLTHGWIVIHLGMSGRLRILMQPQLADKHDHVDLCLQNGTLLRYTDPRRFGCWLWTTDLSQLPQLQKLGPEPLTDAFSATYLYLLSRTKKQPLKSWIMDNQVVVGIGNIYASESLFRAKISPLKMAGQMSKAESTRLVKSIKAVLAKAIEQGGTTLKDFLQSDGKPGYFSQQLQVYGREGLPCFRCQTKIVATKIGQRNSYFCPNCQK